MSKLLSDRVKKTPAAEVSLDRYSFLKLSEAEPDLGVPSGNGYLLTSTTTGARSWVDPATNLAAPGSSTQVIFNNSGVLSGATGLVYVNATGRVGIGTTSPTQLLDVATARHSNVIIGTNATDANKRMALFYDTEATVGVIDATSNHLSLRTLGSERVRINSSGNVGIGTTTPATALDVAGETATNILNVRDLLKLPQLAQDEIDALAGTVPIGSLVQNISTRSVNLYDGVSWVSLVVAGTWTPEDLFLLGEPGVWFDPSDLTTMFQDRVGSQPVTTPGQSVGLILDKSRGLMLGPELRGTGTVGLIGTATAATYNTATGAGSVTRVDLNNQSFVSISSLVNGNTYRVEITVLTGTVLLRAGPAATGNILSTPLTAGSATCFVVPATSLVIAATSETATFTLASVRELSGFHAVANSDASRGIYGIEPFGGRRNLLTFTEQFDNAIWTRDGAITITPNAVAAPDGTTTADLLNSPGFNQNIRQSFVATSTTHTVSAHIRAGSTAISEWLLLTAGFSVVNITSMSIISGPGAIGNNSSRARVSGLTSEWTRFSITYSGLTVGNTYLFGSYVGQSAVGASLGNIYNWGAQLDVGSTATAYQRVTTQYDVTEAGVPTVHYVQFDGIDDGYVTPTITPNTDKVQVFAGVRKANALSALVAELSANAGTNTGGFYLAAPATTGQNRVNFLSRGSAFAVSLANHAGFPLTAVLTGLGDISGDFSRVSVNGVAGEVDATDQGAGNYLAYPLYIGRRGGTTLTFNGRIYSLIVRFGPNITNSLMAQIERWVNQRTGAY